MVSIDQSARADPFEIRRKARAKREERKCIEAILGEKR
jgi:hypothetical protein